MKHSTRTRQDKMASLIKDTPKKRQPQDNHKTTTRQPLGEDNHWKRQPHDKDHYKTATSQQKARQDKSTTRQKQPLDNHKLTTRQSQDKTCNHNAGQDDSKTITRPYNTRRSHEKRRYDCTKAMTKTTDSDKRRQRTHTKTHYTDKGTGTDEDNDGLKYTRHTKTRKCNCYCTGSTEQYKDGITALGSLFF